MLGLHAHMVHVQMFSYAGDQSKLAGESSSSMGEQVLHLVFIVGQLLRAHGDDVCIVVAMIVLDLLQRAIFLAPHRIKLRHKQAVVKSYINRYTLNTFQ